MPRRPAAGILFNQGCAAPAPGIMSHHLRPVCGRGGAPLPGRQGYAFGSETQMGSQIAIKNWWCAFSWLAWIGRQEGAKVGLWRRSRATGRASWAGVGSHAAHPAGGCEQLSDAGASGGDLAGGLRHCSTTSRRSSTWPTTATPGLGGAVRTRDINRALRVCCVGGDGRRVNTNSIPEGAPSAAGRPAARSRETCRVIRGHAPQMKLYSSTFRKPLPVLTQAREHGAETIPEH